MADGEKVRPSLSYACWAQGSWCGSLCSQPVQQLSWIFFEPQCSCPCTHRLTPLLPWQTAAQQRSVMARVLALHLQQSQQRTPRVQRPKRRGELWKRSARWKAAEGQQLLRLICFREFPPHDRCGIFTQAEFKPLVQLDEVETSTGEEDEMALLELWVWAARSHSAHHAPGPASEFLLSSSQCHEANFVSLHVCCRKSKLYRFDTGGNEWKERGVGVLKLLQHKENKKIRLLMRQDKTLKIRANHIGAWLSESWRIEGPMKIATGQAEKASFTWRQQPPPTPHTARTNLMQIFACGSSRLWHLFVPECWCTCNSVLNRTYSRSAAERQRGVSRH